MYVAGVAEELNLYAQKMHSDMPDMTQGYIMPEGMDLDKHLHTWTTSILSRFIAVNATDLPTQKPFNFLEDVLSGFNAVSKSWDVLSDKQQTVSILDVLALQEHLGEVVNTCRRTNFIRTLTHAHTRTHTHTHTCTHTYTYVETHKHTHTQTHTHTHTHTHAHTHAHTHTHTNTHTHTQVGEGYFKQLRTALFNCMKARILAEHVDADESEAIIEAQNVELDHVFSLQKGENDDKTIRDLEYFSVNLYIDERMWVEAFLWTLHHGEQTAQVRDGRGSVPVKVMEMVIEDDEELEIGMLEEAWSYLTFARITKDLLNKTAIDRYEPAYLLAVGNLTENMPLHAIPHFLRLIFPKRKRRISRVNVAGSWCVLKGVFYR